MDHTAVQMMEIDRIECRLQPREVFCEEELTGLAQTIKESGILQPLLVRRDGDAFVVVDGHRRLRAAAKAGLTSVPVIVNERELPPADVLRNQLVLDCQKVHLSAMERARAIERLMSETHWSAAQVSLTLGLSSAQISKYLSLLTADPEIQDRVARGDLAASTAYHITRIRDKGERTNLAEQASRGALTRDDAASKSKRRNKDVARRDRARSAGSRTAVSLGPGLSLVMRGATITLDTLADWTEEFLNKVRSASSGGVTLDAFINSLRTK